MRDTQLYTAIRSFLLAQFATSEEPTTKVKQLRQPISLGADTGPTIYFQKLFDTEIGSPKRKAVWNAGRGDFDNQLVQKVATTFQILGIYKQTAAGLGWTASDLANEAKAFLQTDDAIAAFLFIGVGVERITSVRNPDFTDGQSQFEFMPTFDFVLTHDQVTVTRTPRVSGYEFDLERV